MSEETIFQEPTPPTPPLMPPVPIAGNPIIKIGIILFLLLTILFSFLTFVLPRVSNKPEEKNVTLTYWGLLEDSNVMKPVIAEFEKDNPTIKIDYTAQDPKDYKEKLVTRIKNGNGPDIFRFHNTWYPMLSDILLPLPKETIEKREFVNNYYDVTQSDLIKNGAIYGIPLGIDTLALFINPEVFDEASKEQGSEIKIPTTWQEFINASQALTKRNEDGKIDIGGAGIGTFENVTHGPDIISLLLVQNGIDPNNIKASDPKVVDTLRFYTNFALLENNVWDETLDTSLLAFSQGKLAMYFGYSWDYFMIKNTNPNINFKIVPVPQLLSDKNANLARYFAEGVSSKSKHQKEALLFMKFLAKPETQEKFYEAVSKVRSFGEPYSIKKFAQKLKDTDSFVFVEQAKTAMSSPFVDGTYDNGLNDNLNDYLKDAINSILSGGSEESAANTLFQGYSRVMEDYGLRAPETDK